MGCFWFSEKVREKKKTVNSDHRKKIMPFSWTRFWMKKADVKNVPVDIPVPEKASRRKLIVFVKKVTSKRQLPAAGKIPEDFPEQVVKDEFDETKSESENKIVLEVPNHQNDMPPREFDACPQRSSFSRNPTAATPKTTPLSHSSSFPATSRKRKEEDVSGGSQKLPAAVVGESQRGRAASKIDPVVGLSIVVVTLIIMLIWGRLCAVLCTSAWLYFVPRLTATASFSDDASFGLHGRSEVQDKKKVVLEGFLERKKPLSKAKRSL